MNKSIIKRIIVGVVIGFILMNINKCSVKAYVYKTDVWNPMNQYSVSGYVAGGSNNQKIINFDINGNTLMTQSLDYDILVFKFNNMNFKQNSDFSGGFSSNDNYLYCTKWVQSGSTYTCSSYSTLGPNGSTYSSTNLTTENNFALSIGKIYLQGALYYNDNVNNKSTCFMSSDLQDMFLCPINKQVNKQITDFEIIISNNGGVGIDYSFELSGLKYGFNYESTEIVNGLSGVQQAQQQTVDAITDTNITGANTSTNSALSSIDNSVSSTLNNAIDPNALYTLLTGFVNQLSSSTCTPITLPIPYTNENIVLPCLGTEFSQRIPVIWSLYELIITGVIVLRFWQHAVEFVLNILDPYHIGANNVPTGGGK